MTILNKLFLSGAIYQPFRPIQLNNITDILVIFTFVYMYVHCTEYSSYAWIQPATDCVKAGPLKLTRLHIEFIKEFAN